MNFLLCLPLVQPLVVASRTPIGPAITLLAVPSTNPLPALASSQKKNVAFDSRGIESRGCREVKWRLLARSQWVSVALFVVL